LSPRLRQTERWKRSSRAASRVFTRMRQSDERGEKEREREEGCRCVTSSEGELERRRETRNREAANRSAKARKFYRRHKTVRPCARTRSPCRYYLFRSDEIWTEAREERWREACILFIGSLRWRKRARKCTRERVRGARDNVKILVSRGRFYLAKLATQMRLANSPNEPKPRWVMVVAIIARRECVSSNNNSHSTPRDAFAKFGYVFCGLCTWKVVKLKLRI